ncbi:MAG: hypothetical protein HC880_19120, partial [Bacteroidia bacterium]|nr:hypothetical protein [Bacteroidia bacterium]
METVRLALIVSFLVTFSGLVQAQYVPEEKRQTETAADTTAPKKKEKTQAGREKPEKAPKVKSESTNSFWKKISFGGNIGGGFGDPTFLDISPTIGYKLSDKFELGLGPNYAYYRFKNDSFSADDHLYGGRVYGQFNLTKSIFARGEIESIRVSFPDSGLAEAPVRR